MKARPIVTTLAVILAAAVAQAEPRGGLGSPQQESDLGRRAALQAAAQMGIVEKPGIEEFIQAIGRRLARHAPGYRYGYEFHVVDQGAPNAFALPGGFVFVSRGSLILANSEAEIANIVGHEIGHAALRHASAQYQVVDQGILRNFKQPYLAAYGRDLERSADRVGQGLAAVAGYDPAGLGEFLRGLNRLERFRRGRSRIPGFMDTHPSSQSRAIDANGRAGLIAWEPVPPIVGSRGAYLEKIEGLVVGDAAAQGVFVGNRFMHADLAFTFRFPDGWTQQNSPRAVGALSPRRDAWVALEFAGEGTDPQVAADVWIEEQEGVRIEREEWIKLIGREAYRVRGRAPTGMSFIVTFLPHRGSVYRITAAAGNLGRYEPQFLQVARSFRPMTRELLSQVKERRLRIVRARPAETFSELVERTGSAWSAAEAAVFNGRMLDALLEAGEPIKIAVEVAYQPRIAR